MHEFIYYIGVGVISSCVITMAKITSGVFIRWENRK